MARVRRVPSPAGCPMALGCDPAGANVDDSCGGRRDSANRIYFTSAALNDDGDFVHFLVHRSARLANTFYFGFEDLYRGGDNDFEDMFVRGAGLVPLCDARPETCNNADDDCDGAVDEGITMACSTACGTRRSDVPRGCVRDLLCARSEHGDMQRHRRRLRCGDRRGIDPRLHRAPVAPAPRFVSLERSPIAPHRQRVLRPATTPTKTATGALTRA